MALIATHNITTVGTPPTFAPAAVGDTATVGDRFFLVVRNADATSKTVTLTTTGNLATGDAYPDKAYTILAGAEAWIPLGLREYRDASDGLAHIAYSATTSVTRALVRA